jgi:hypothetical protein
MGGVRGKWLFNRSCEASKDASDVESPRKNIANLNFPSLLQILSNVQVPAFPVPTTFFLLLHHVFVQHSTSSVKEPCLITEDEALEYYGFQKMKNTNLKLEPAHLDGLCSPFLSVTHHVFCTLFVILAVLNGG